MRIYILFFAIVGLWRITDAQEIALDSLASILKVTKEDTSKVIRINSFTKQLIVDANFLQAKHCADTNLILINKLLFNELSSHQSSGQVVRTLKYAKGDANNYLGVIYKEQGNFDSAHFYFITALALFEETKLEKSQAKVLGNLGMVYGNRRQPETALDYYSRALNIYREFNDNKEQARIHGNIGNVYASQGKYDVALDNYHKALELNVLSDNEKSQGIVLGNIGIVYYQQKEYPKALEYFRQSLSYAERNGNKTSQLNNLSNIGVVYERLGEYTLSLLFLNQALLLSEELGDLQGKASSLENIANVYRAQGDSAIAKGNKIYAFSNRYPAALEYYVQALEIAVKIGDNKIKATVIGSIGVLFHKWNFPTKAKAYLIHSIALCDSAKAYEELGSFAYYLSEIYTTEEDWEKALQYYQIHASVNDSVGVTNGAAQTRVGMQFGFNKQQASYYVIINRLRQQMQYGIFIIALCFAILSIYGIESTRQRKKHESFEKQSKQMAQKLALMHDYEAQILQKIPVFLDVLIDKYDTVEQALKIGDARKANGIKKTIKEEVVKTKAEIKAKSISAAESNQDENKLASKNRRAGVIAEIIFWCQKDKKVLVFLISIMGSLIYCAVISLVIYLGKWGEFEPYMSIIQQLSIGCSAAFGLYLLKYGKRE
jgi:tetratricopeptide (TPR) repeat protein